MNGNKDEVYTKKKTINTYDKLFFSFYLGHQHTIFLVFKCLKNNRVQKNSKMIKKLYIFMLIFKSSNKIKTGSFQTKTLDF